MGQKFYRREQFIKSSKTRWVRGHNCDFFQCEYHFKGMWVDKWSVNILPVTGDCSRRIPAIRVKLLAQNWSSFFILFFLSQYFDHCNRKNLIRVQNYSFNVFFPLDYFCQKSYFYFISSQGEIIESKSL